VTVHGVPESKLLERGKLRGRVRESQNSRRKPNGISETKRGSAKEHQEGCISSQAETNDQSFAEIDADGVGKTGRQSRPAQEAARLAAASPKRKEMRVSL
jgi:hypothetical protein